MSTLVIDRSNLEVRCDGAALAVYEYGERRGTVPIKLLDRVVLQGTIRLDTAVLTRLAEAGIPTVLVGARSSRRVATLLGPSHRDAAVRLGQFRCALDRAWCEAWSRRLVLAKTRGQRAFLCRAIAERPDQRKALFDAKDAIASALRPLEDSVAASTASIRGTEGACAAAYFRGLCALFPEGLGFRGRNRRPPKDPVNAALSLAYAMLHFDAVRAAHVAGLDPMIGFYHCLAHGRESLACDLVEPLRPRADSWVWSLFRGRTLRAEHFSIDKGACLLVKAGRERFYGAYEAFANLPRRWLRRQCSSLATALRAQSDGVLVDSDPDEVEE